MNASIDNRAGAVRRPPALYLLLGVLSLLALAFAPPAGAEGPSLQHSSFPPGEAVVETVLRVPETGRYSLGATGRAGGLRLELVDRMAGTIASAEDTAGVRLDAFLEKGEYKVRIGRPPAEPVGLAVHAFPVVGAGGRRAPGPTASTCPSWPTARSRPASCATWSCAPGGCGSIRPTRCCCSRCRAAAWPTRCSGGTASGRRGCGRSRAPWSRSRGGR